MRVMLFRMGIFWQVRALAMSIMAVGVVVGMSVVLVVVSMVRMVISAEISLERHVVVVVAVAAVGVGVRSDGVYKGPTDEGTRCTSTASYKVSLGRLARVALFKSWASPHESSARIYEPFFGIYFSDRTLELGRYV